MEATANQARSNRPNLLVLLTRHPRQDARSMEGLRCARALAGDARWEVSVACCDDALDWLEQLESQDLTLLPASQACRWYALGPQPSASIEAHTITLDWLNPSQWLDLGLRQQVILLF